MTTPEQARNLAELMDSFADSKTVDQAVFALTDLANQVERLEAQRKELREALESVLELVTFENIKKARAALKATE